MLSSTVVGVKPFFAGQTLQQQRRHCLCRGTKQERAAERDEQWEAQQEVLKRRRGNLWQNDVEARRAEVRKYQTNPAYKKQKKDEVPKWGIIIPIAPFGMPEYDGGERFDLRLPHVDNGWVDEDASFGKTMARIFRWQKKEDKEAMNGKPGNALKGKTGKGKK
ncbi:MAG: hypothetical protein FRX49_09630 [Trebouxia sp. A1-2]|nr:MAG: hypothetical protein FRX49_09630 [Trebouxia sp. A1-2]